MMLYNNIDGVDYKCLDKEEEAQYNMNLQYVCLSSSSSPKALWEVKICACLISSNVK